MLLEQRQEGKLILFALRLVKMAARKATYLPDRFDRYANGIVLTPENSVSTLGYMDFSIIVLLGETKEFCNIIIMTTSFQAL